jgi:hypothetical protein
MFVTNSATYMIPLRFWCLEFSPQTQRVTKNAQDRPNLLCIEEAEVSRVSTSTSLSSSQPNNPHSQFRYTEVPSGGIHTHFKRIYSQAVQLGQ